MMRRIAALGLILVLAAGIPIQASSASTEKVTEDAASTKSLQEAQDEKAQLEKALKEAQSTIEDLRDSKGDIESKVTELNQQLIDISARITDLENQLTAKSEDIQETKDELAGAKEREAQQYADMKVRIQFMYENGSTPVWQMLAEAESFLSWRIMYYRPYSEDWETANHRCYLYWWHVLLISLEIWH